MKDGLTTIVDNMAKLVGGIEELRSTRVMVGVPAEKADRRQEGEPINNAALAYIHDNGAPEVNVPPRPFMVPGIEAAQDKIATRLQQAGDAALDGRPQAVERAFNAAGLAAQLSIQNKITEGIPPPLADSTLRERARQRSGRQGIKTEIANRAAGLPASTELAKPLVDTGELRGKISFVIRKPG